MLAEIEKEIKIFETLMGEQEEDECE